MSPAQRVTDSSVAATAALATPSDAALAPCQAEPRQGVVRGAGGGTMRVHTTFICAPPRVQRAKASEWIGDEGESERGAPQLGGIRALVERPRRDEMMLPLAFAGLAVSSLTGRLRAIRALE